MMHTNREILEEQFGTCEDKLKGLISYVNELKTMTARHGTPKEQFEPDLMEATNNIGYYKVELARLNKEMATAARQGRPRTVSDTLLPKTRNQGIGAALLSSISFLAGALFGSQVKSGKSSKDRQNGN